MLLNYYYYFIMSNFIIFYYYLLLHILSIITFIVIIYYLLCCRCSCGGGVFILLRLGHLPPSFRYDVYASTPLPRFLIAETANYTIMTENTDNATMENLADDALNEFDMKYDGPEEDNSPRKVELQLLTTKRPVGKNRRQKCGGRR